MTNSRRRRPLKIIIYALYLFVCFLLQSSVFSALPIHGAKPFILPLAVIGVSVFEGSVRGGIFGIAAGVLCDVSLNQPAIQFTLLLTFLGICGGLLTETVLANGFPSYVVLAVFSLFIVTFMQIFSPVVFYKVAFSSLADKALWQVVYSAFFLIPVYLTSRRLGRLFGV